MWENVGNAALYGAIGGGLGGLIGATIASLFRKTAFAQWASIIFSVSGVVLGANLAKPLLEPHIGEFLPKSDLDKATEDQLDLIFAEFENFPLMVAILERDPNIRDELKAKLQTLVEEAKTPAIARQMGFSAGYNLVAGKVTHFLARAQDVDLLKFINLSVEMLNDLNQRDPRFCYDYLYNPGALVGMTKDDLKNRLGAEMFDRQQAEGAELVRNAFEKVPAYDIAAADAAINEAAGVFQSMLGDKIGLVSGMAFPSDDEEASLACSATAALYSAILAQENPVLAGRHIFVRAGG